MLIDLVPTKSAKIQNLFSLLGLIIGMIGILSKANLIFYSGISFLLIGSIFLFKDIVYMISYKETNYE